MHRGRRTHRRREIGRPAVDEHVDVPPESRTLLLDEPVTHPRGRAVERVEDLIDRAAGQLVPALDARKEREQRPREEDRRQRTGQESRTTASTAQISGRLAVTSRHDSPSSALCQSWPVFVPNVTPTGSSVSRAIASRRTLR